MNLNYKMFKGAEFVFRSKYKRDYRVWTISEVHDLYLKVLQRHMLRQAEWIDCVKRIVEETNEFESGVRKVFFTREGKIYQRVISRSDNLGIFPWGVHSAELVNFSNNSTFSRNEKLEFILSNEKSFELGELYESLVGSTRFLHLLIKEILSDMVEDELRLKFKQVVAPEILTLSIGQKRYYVECVENTRHTRFKKFKILNEVNGENEGIKL